MEPRERQSKPSGHQAAGTDSSRRSDSPPDRSRASSAGAARVPETASGSGAASGPQTPPGLINRGLPHLDDLYREVVLDHYKHPRGRRKLDSPSVSMEGYNPTCGDQVHIALAVEGDRIKQAQVECQGCSISVASGSMMAELLEGKTKEEIDALTQGFKEMMHGRPPEAGLDLGDLEALEGVRQFPVRIKCALLAWTTLQEALAAFTGEGNDPERRGDGTAGDSGGKKEGGGRGDE